MQGHVFASRSIGLNRLMHLPAGYRREQESTSCRCPNAPSLGHAEPAATAGNHAVVPGPPPMNHVGAQIGAALYSSSNFFLPALPGLSMKAKPTPSTRRHLTSHSKM